MSRTFTCPRTPPSRGWETRQTHSRLVRATIHRLLSSERGPGRELGRQERV